MSHRQARTQHRNMRGWKITPSAPIRGKTSCVTYYDDKVDWCSMDQMTSDFPSISPKLWLKLVHTWSPKHDWVREEQRVFCRDCGRDAHIALMTPHGRMSYFRSPFHVYRKAFLHYMLEDDCDLCKRYLCRQVQES